ncbi:MAG TPA: peroxiredoxin [Polyangiales bacterium]|nr:peroxiredoxin [Polyangiales bacterium]
MAERRMDACGDRGGIPYVGRGSRWAAKSAGFLAVLLLASLFACGAQQRPDGGKGVLEVGAAAPDVEGVDIAGKHFRLSENRTKPAVVYFYPKDGTPGCTKEACAFRDTWNRFTERGVVVFGVSRDSAASHASFLKEHELPFPLVADESGAIQEAYGVPSRLGMAARVTFLVDQSGRVAHVWPNVDPAVHADEVLKAVAELERTNPH